jgi:hypothetical protein
LVKNSIPSAISKRNPTNPKKIHKTYVNFYDSKESFMNFSSLHLNNRYYFFYGQYDETEIKKIVIQNEKENKGLGTREYGKISGFLLSLIGFSFKTFDISGNSIYLNCKSYHHFLSRISICNNSNFSPNQKVQNEYLNEKNKENIKKICEIFSSLIQKKNENIIELSKRILTTLAPPSSEQIKDTKNTQSVQNDQDNANEQSETDNKDSNKKEPELSQQSKNEGNLLEVTHEENYGTPTPKDLHPEVEEPKETRDSKKDDPDLSQQSKNEGNLSEVTHEENDGTPAPEDFRSEGEEQKETSDNETNDTNITARDEDLSTQIKNEGTHQKEGSNEENFYEVPECFKKPNTLDSEWKELSPVQQESFTSLQIFPIKSLHIELLNENPLFLDVISPFLHLLSTCSPTGEEEIENWMSLIKQIQNNWKKVKNKKVINWKKGSFSQWLDKLLQIIDRICTPKLFQCPNNADYLFEVFTALRKIIQNLQNNKLNKNHMFNCLKCLQNVDFNKFVKIENGNTSVDLDLINQDPTLDSLSKKIIIYFLDFFVSNTIRLKNLDFLEKTAKELKDNKHSSDELDLTKHYGFMTKCLEIFVNAYGNIKTIAYKVSKIKLFSKPEPLELIQDDLEYLINRIAIYLAKLLLNNSPYFLEFIDIISKNLNHEQKKISERIQLILTFLNKLENEDFQKKYLKVEIESLSHLIKTLNALYHKAQEQPYFKSLVEPLLDKMFEIGYDCDLSQDCCEINHYDWIKTQFLMPFLKIVPPILKKIKKTS